MVVPSPAKSDVFEATSRTIWAPMFSNLSSSSISLATVTPSLVMRGAPKLLSSTTLRPFGPSVTLTALARMSTPRSILSRASYENLTSLAAISTSLRRELIGSSGALRRPSCCATSSSSTPMMSLSFMIRYSTPSILTSVPDHLPNSTRSPTFTSIGISLPASSRPPGPTATISPCEGFSFAVVGNDDAAGGLLLGVDALDDDAVVKRAELHDVLLGYLIRLRYFAGTAVRQTPRRTARSPHRWQREKPQERLRKFFSTHLSGVPTMLSKWFTRPGSTLPKGFYSWNSAAFVPVCLMRFRRSEPRPEGAEEVPSGRLLADLFSLLLVP